MGLYNNVPTFTYVSATGITVTYNKQVYTVQSFYTNKKYIYWDYDNATVLQASNTMPTRSFKTHLVIINDNGIATAVPSTYDGFEISYTGDSDEAIKSKIYALYEKDREHGEKFVAIEKDIDGIRQIVGSTETDEGKGTIIDRLSSIEQTSKDISLKVEENQTTYNSDKEATKLREDLNSAIINLNADLSTFNGEMIAYYKDDKISNEEKVSIETMLELITNSKSEVLVYADKVKLVAQANENTSGVTSLNSAIQSLDIVHTSLINIVTTAIGDGIIIPTEKTVITNAIAQYNLKINEFKNTCDDIIFLGFGGTVVEKLSQISMKSNEIKLSVSTVESNFTSGLSLQKEELKGQIEDVSNSLGTFKSTVETTFRDGLITEAEKKVLLEKIEQLEKEKLDVDARYLDAYNNKYLVSPYKENLKSQHDKFDNKHSELKSKISEVVALGNVTENETLQINTLFNEYSVILSNLKVVLDNSLDIISTGKASEEILKAKEELSEEIGDINNTLENVVDNLDYLVSDGIVDTSERKVIEATLTSLEKEKTDVEAQFTYWSSNSYLIDPLRSQYDEVYETYLAKYENVVFVIEGIIYKEGLVNDTDRNNMIKAHTDLTNTLYDFLDKTNEVIEFVTLKQYEDLISVVEEDIKDIYGNLKELDIVLDGTLEDNFLNEAEKIAIREQLAILDREKVEVDANHENVYNNPYLSTELKTDLKSEYDSYVSSYNYLVSTIEEIVNTDGLIPTTSQIEYSNAVNEYKENIGIYTIILKECVDDISNNSIDEAKEILHNEISDVIGSLEKLETDMNEVFRDGVLSDAEKTTIKQQLETLKKEKGDVDKQYSALYSNASLVDTTSAKPKSELKTAYDNFVTKYNSLVSTINTIIAKTTIVDNTDRANLSNALTNYRTASSTYMTKATNAIDSIAGKKATDESEKVNEKYAEILLSDDGIVNRVGAVEKETATNAGGLKTLNERVSNAELKLEPDAIISTVSQTITNAVENVEIGSRNLLLNTNTNKSVTGTNTSNQCTTLYSLTSDKSDLGGRELTLSFTYTVSNYKGGNFKIQSASVVYNSWETIKPTGNGTFKYENTITSESSFSSNTSVQIRMDGFQGTVVISKMKLEKGNKSTDYTVAPEDIQSQISENASNITSTSSKVATIETNLSGITSRVSSVETKQTTTNNNLASLTTRVTSAETKLTQTEKDFNFKIENVGAENLIKNSDFSAGIEQWEKNGWFTWHIPVSGSEISYNYGKMICIQNSGGGVGIFQRFNTIVGQKYTVSFYTEGTQQTPTDTVIGIEGVKTITLNVEPYFKRWSFTFTATSNRHTFVAYLGTAGKFYLGRVMVTQGTVLQEYRKHTSEIYSTTVKIDVDGIEIDSTGANTINKINTNGMIITDKSNNTDLLKATSSGVVARGGSFYVDDPSNGYTRLWGRDIDINGQRALVGTNSSPQDSLIANKLYINYLGDFKNGTEITGSLTNNSFNVLSDVGSSITQNGYIKLSNGLIIQWGHVMGLTISNGRVVDAHIKYPIDFPNAIITFIPSIDTVDGNNYMASRYNILGKTNNNRTHGWVYGYNWTDSPQGALMDINYIAIGC